MFTWLIEQNVEQLLEENISMDLIPKKQSDSIAIAKPIEYLINRQISFEENTISSSYHRIIVLFLDVDR